VHPRWQAESPFQDSYSQEPPAPAATPSSPVIARAGSPFLDEVDFPGRLGETDTSHDVVAELLADIHDQEFDEAVTELMDEAWEVANVRTLGEYGDDAARDVRVQRLIAEHFEPLVRHTEELLERAGHELRHLDPLSMGEAAFREALDRYEPELPDVSPTFEHFIGSYFRKFKNAAALGANLLRSGVGSVARLAARPFVALLAGKFQAVVKPLVARAIQLAQSKIPAQYRPALAALAARFGVQSPAAPAGALAVDAAATPAEPAAATPAEPAAAATPTEPAAPDSAEIQSELDQMLVQTLLARDDQESELAERDYVERSAPEPDPTVALERARDRFVREITVLDEGGDPRPALEHFLPAVLSVLPLVRKVVGMIGRDKVLGLVSNVVTPLIKPIVGPAAQPLGRMLADLGLRALLQGELSPEDARDSAGRAVAATVEEVVRRVAELPDSVLKDDAQLEAQVREAFDTAAAANFPASVVREELREVGTGDGAWMQMPARGPRKEYKTYSRPFDVELTPQVARSIHTYGGSTLHSFLQDRHRLPMNAPVRARVHLYEALPGTRPSRVARLDRRLGLDNARGAERVFHPLTPEAALGLLREPRLGRPTPPWAKPSQLSVGQRFYHVQVDGSRLAQSRESHLRLRLDFVRNQARVHLFLAEPLAQQLAGAVRRRDPAATIRNALRSAFASSVQALRSGVRGGMVQVILGASRAGGSNVEGAAGRGAAHALQRQVELLTIEWLWHQLLEYFRRGAAGFAAAVARPEDGVSLNVVFHNPPSFPAVRRILQGERGGALQQWPPAQMPEASVSVTVGHARA
jgi:hypothetical protein